MPNGGPGTLYHYSSVQLPVLIALISNLNGHE
jgi:hypothetical protein